MASFDLSNQAAAGIPTPSTGNTAVFVDTDKLLKSKNDAGVVTNYGAPGTAITSLTGDVTAAGPGAAAASISSATVTAKLLTGLTPVAGTLSATDSILQAFNKLASKLSCSWFGNGIDGDVTIAVDTTLVRDMYYNSLTVNLGATLFTAGFRVHVLNDCNVTGKIDRSGNDATGTAATAALTAGVIGGSGAGGAGGTAAGSAGGAVTNAAGGAGGIGGATASAGGAVGAASVPIAATGGVEVLNSARQAVIGQQIAGVIMSGGGGGGGGAGDGTAGGAGGSGGGILIISARNLLGTGRLQAHGGNGFQPTAGNRGGGAGGGGGAIVVVTENDTTATSLVFDIAGGIGASGFGTGGAGANGSNGRIVRVRT
jgi:hypothetical protein